MKSNRAVNMSGETRRIIEPLEIGTVVPDFNGTETIEVVS